MDFLLANAAVVSILSRHKSGCLFLNDNVVANTCSAGSQVRSNASPFMQAFVKRRYEPALVLRETWYLVYQLGKEIT